MKTSNAVKNMLFVVLLLSTAAYLGCASTAKFSYGDAKNGFMLSYRGEKGEVMGYEADNKVYIVQDMMGQEMEIVSTTQMGYELKVEELAENRDLHFGITFTKFKSSAETPQGTFSGDTDELIGKSAGLVVNSQGKLVKMVDLIKDDADDDSSLIVDVIEDLTNDLTSFKALSADARALAKVELKTLSFFLTDELRRLKNGLRLIEAFADSQ